MDSNLHWAQESAMLSVDSPSIKLGGSCMEWEFFLPLSRYTFGLPFQKQFVIPWIFLEMRGTLRVMWLVLWLLFPVEKRQIFLQIYQVASKPRQRPVSEIFDAILVFGKME